MKVLVTGNLGYIGPLLTEALTRAGHEVHGYDCAWYLSYALEPLPTVAVQHVADIRDSASLDRALAPCDAVVHLAAISNDPLGELDAETTRQVNGTATVSLLERAGDRRVILFSSASVYGASETRCAETAPVRPLTLYSELKVAAERAALARPGRLVLRNGTVHGPAPLLRGDLLLNSMVASAVALGEIVLMTSPSTMRPVLDVRDLARLVAGLLDRDVAGLFNVAAANVSVGEAAALVARATGARIVERYDGADPRDYAMDTDRLAAAAPWWRPRALDRSVEDLAAFVRRSGMSAEDVRARRYHRLTQYRSRVATPAAT